MKRFFGKTLFGAAATAAICLTTSCSTKKNAVTELAGEWNIVKVGDTDVRVQEGEETPFLGFDNATGRLFGNAGCNSLMGSYTADTAKGTVTFSQLGSTRMMCPDMTLEDNLLKVLPTVAAYRATTDGNIELTNATGTLLITLSPKE